MIKTCLGFSRVNMKLRCWNNIPWGTSRHLLQWSPRVSAGVGTGTRVRGRLLPPFLDQKHGFRRFRSTVWDIWCFGGPWHMLGTSTLCPLAAQGGKTCMCRPPKKKRLSLFYNGAKQAFGPFGGEETTPRVLCAVLGLLGPSPLHRASRSHPY